MKKLLFVSTLSMMCILGTTAMAEGNYTAGESSYADSVVNGAKTVVIYKGETTDAITDENIYYIDENNAEGGFSGFRALLKVNTPAGKYQVVTNDPAKAATFTVSEGEAAVSGATEMSFLGLEKQADGTYSVGYSITVDDGFLQTSTITMLLGNTAYTTNLFGGDVVRWDIGNGYEASSPRGINIEGTMKCAIQIDYVDAQYMTISGDTATPKFDMYFRR